MYQKTSFLPGISHLLFGSQRRSQLDKIRLESEQWQQASLHRLCEIFGTWMPAKVLSPTLCGPNSRKRVFPMSLTFWAFLSQVLSPFSSCRETVRKVQVMSARRGKRLPDSGTSAYCQARNRLPVASLIQLHKHLANQLSARVPASDLWRGSRVKVVDGTGLSMPDTADNQKAWPQPSEQKSGCGFPVMKLVACFCLASGALLEWVEGTLKDHDCRLFKKLLEGFNKGDVVLGDRAFGSYPNLASLVKRGANAVMRVHQFRKLNWRSGKRLGYRDRLVTWNKGTLQSTVWTPEEWAELPEQMTVRLVQIEVKVPGFRTQVMVLVTTLLDAHLHSPDSLGELYFRRWAIELFFRDIKTTLGMDVLRCKSAAMVRKEVVMHALAFNLIRGLMQDIALNYQIQLNRLSFEGTMASLRQWSYLFEHDYKAAPKTLRSLFYETIAEDLLHIRPERSEPRVVKRRPKNFRLLTKPRHQMIVERCRKWSQKPSKNALN